MARKKLDNMRRMRLNIPEQDLSVTEWLDKQLDASASIRAVIRDYIQRNGYTDPTCGRVEQIRRGRPVISDDESLSKEAVLKWLSEQNTDTESSRESVGAAAEAVTEEKPSPKRGRPKKETKQVPDSGPVTEESIRDVIQGVLNRPEEVLPKSKASASNKPNPAADDAPPVFDDDGFVSPDDLLKL